MESKNATARYIKIAQDICNKIICLGEEFNIKFKHEIDKMPKIAIRDYDEDIDKLNEIKAINRNDFPKMWFESFFDIWFSCDSFE